MTEYNLNFSRAYDVLDATAAIKQKPEDFQVTERLGFEPSGEGEHVFLFIRKTNITTEAVATDLAKIFKLKTRDIAYSGLKDKVALTRQWFSVPWPIKKAIPEITGINWAVECQNRHIKKLKRGTHKSNHFLIRLCDIKGNKNALSERLELIKKQGVPNYFAEQRFGWQGGNIEKARRFFSKPYKLSPYKRGIYYSAVRAFLFNHYLSQRILDKNWSQAIAGDCFNLANSNSIFTPEVIDSTIEQRVSTLDIHPSGPLIGENSSSLAAKALHYEIEVRDHYPELVQGLVAAKVKTDHRALRLLPENLVWEIDDQSCTVSFSLVKGSYATSVIGELLNVNGALW